MAFKTLSYVKREPHVVKCESLKKKVGDQKKKKLMRVSHTFGHFEWTITNFALKLNLQVEGLNLHKNLSSFPTFEEVVFVFGKR